MQDACNARGLNITSIALFGTIPVVPTDLTLPHKLGYILGPICGVLAILAFFGALIYLDIEKRSNIKHAENDKDVEAARRKGSRPGCLGALAGILTCAACRGGRNRGAAARKTATTPAAGVSPMKEPQQTTPNRGAPAAGAPAGVSPTRDPRNLSPLNMSKSGKREAGNPQAPAQNDFMTSNPVYGSQTPATPATPASGGRSPVTDFFRNSSRKVWLLSASKQGCLFAKISWYR